MASMLLSTCILREHKLYRPKMCAFGLPDPEYLRDDDAVAARDTDAHRSPIGAQDIVAVRGVGHP